MLASALGVRTWLHRVPAGGKLLALAVCSLAFFWVQDWRVLGGALICVIALYATLGRGALARIALLRPLLPLLVIIGALQFWVVDASAASAVVLRLLLLVLIADLVSMTTPMLEMMDAIEPLLRPLARLGVDSRRLGLAVALMVRFVPTLFEDWRRREEAWRARTGRRASIRLLAPWVGDLLRLADHVGDALDARGFSARRQSGDTRGNS